MSRGRGRRWVLIAVCLVGLVCCGGGITGGVVTLRSGLMDVGPVRDTTNAFVDDLQNTRFADAYGRLCTTLRSLLTLDQFTQEVRAEPAIHDHQLKSVHVASVDGQTTAQVGTQLTRDGGTVDTETFALTKQGGDWTMCSKPAY